MYCCSQETGRNSQRNQAKNRGHVPSTQREQVQYGGYLETRFPIVLLELNELTPSLMERFILEGDSGNLSRQNRQASSAQSRSPSEEARLEQMTRSKTDATSAILGEQGLCAANVSASWRRTNYLSELQ